MSTAPLPSAPLPSAPPTGGAVRVLLPRPSGRGSRLAELLRAQGLHPEHHPVVELRLHDDAPMREAVTRLAAGEVEHLVLTSPRAVEALAAITADALRIPPAVTVTVVGEGTASALREHGHEPDRIADGSGAALVELFPDASAPPAEAVGSGAVARPRVLFPASAAAAPTVPDGLECNGYTVDRVTAYSPHPIQPPPQAVDDLRAGAYRAVVLTSAMIARIIAELGVHPGTGVVTIGDPTSAAARAAGLTVHAQATAPTDQALAAAVRAVLDPPQEPR